jgi:hypothetical protein
MILEKKLTARIKGIGRMSLQDELRDGFRYYLLEPLICILDDAIDHHGTSEIVIVPIPATA